MVSNFHHTWVTDWQLAPRSFAITNGMSLCLPPECIDRLIGGQNAYMTACIRFQLHNLMFSHFTVGGSFPLDQARHNGMLEYFTHCIRLYKEFIRPILPTCKIYHHTPVLDYPMAKGFGILEMASPDGAKGVLGVFQLSNPAEKETVIKLRGVDVSRTYRVCFDNTGKTVEVDGLRLAGEGLYVRLEGALTSELITYEAI